jgi:hypothetical protein
MDFLAFSLGHLRRLFTIGTGLIPTNGSCFLASAPVCLIPPLVRLPLVLGHTPAILFLLFAFLLAGPVYDRFAHGRINAAYKWGIPLIVLSFACSRRICFHTRVEKPGCLAGQVVAAEALKVASNS